MLGLEVFAVTSIPDIVEKMAPDRGYKTGTLRNKIYGLLPGLTDAELKKAGVVRRGKGYKIVNEALFNEWFDTAGEKPGETLGPQYGVKEIPSDWDLADFIKKAKGRYALRAFTRRFGSVLNADYYQLGGASRHGEDRSAMGIYKSEAGYWCVDAREYVKYLIREGYYREEG